jgi:hypothetical protein
MSNNNTQISFLHIKPVSDKNIIQLIDDTVFKLSNSNSLNYSNDAVEDLLIDLEDCIMVKTAINHIEWINNYFKGKYESVISDQTQTQTQYYDIMSFDSDNEKNIYYLLITDRIINSSGFMEKKTATEQKNSFNLIGSTLSKYYSNNGVIFGDVFLTAIDKNYYDILLEIDQLNEKNMDTTVFEKQLSQINKLYIPTKPFDFVKSFANVHYLKIFTMPDKKVHIYKREIIDSYLKSDTTTYSRLDSKSSILKLNFENMHIYTKYTDVLPNSHSTILNIINTQSDSTTSVSNNFYLTNLSDDDINKIIKMG